MIRLRTVCAALALPMALLATSTAIMAQELPDNEDTRQYVGPRDDSYMLLQGRIIQLEDRVSAAEEAILALVEKLDANALRDKELLSLLMKAGVIREQR